MSCDLLYYTVCYVSPQASSLHYLYRRRRKSTILKLIVIFLVPFNFKIDDSVLYPADVLVPVAPVNYCILMSKPDIQSETVLDIRINYRCGEVIIKHNSTKLDGIPSTKTNILLQ